MQWVTTYNVEQRHGVKKNYSGAIPATGNRYAVSAAQKTSTGCPCNPRRISTTSLIWIITIFLLIPPPIENACHVICQCLDRSVRRSFASTAASGVWNYRLQNLANERVQTCVKSKEVLYNVLILGLSKVNTPLILEIMYVLISICDHFLSSNDILCTFNL